jgi:hypothetical protein
MEQTTRGKDFYANFRVRSRPAPPALRRVAVLPRLTAPLCAPRCPRPPSTSLPRLAARAAAVSEAHHTRTLRVSQPLGCT